MLYPSAQPKCIRCNRHFAPRKPTHRVCNACILHWVMQTCANCGRNIEIDEGDPMCTCTEEERKAALMEDE